MSPVNQLITAEVVATALDDALVALIDFSARPDFATSIRTVFGHDYSAEAFRTLLTQLPKIEILDPDRLQGAIGAFSEQTDTIYLAQQLPTNGPELLQSVLIEEIGHFIDTHINSLDTRGDEGEYLAAVVSNRPLTDFEAKRIESEDDHGVIDIAGQAITIERASISESGGEGGITTQLVLDSDSRNVTINYYYEHYSIPDQFEIRYAGTPLFSTGGLVSGSRRGTVTLRRVAGVDFAEIVVTAPESGTAWNFDVSTANPGVSFDGLVGDVIKLQLEQQRGNLTLQSLPDPSKGTLIDSKGDIAKVGTTYSKLYFVPKLDGSIAKYGETKQHPGIGQASFEVEDQNHEAIKVSVNVQDG